MLDLQISELNPAVPLNVQMPSKELYTHLGEAGIRQMINNHYNLLRVSEIAQLFPKSDEAFAQAQKNSADFFVQIFGGHPHYSENRGKPMLARRHQPFSITAQGRKVWLGCYQEVLQKLDGVPENVVLSFWSYLDEFSKRMVNS